MDLQQRKCSVIFDLSCNLARVLEFCTREIPQAFLSGSDMNLRRLVELIVFILNHLMAVADPDFIELYVSIFVFHVSVIKNKKYYVLHLLKERRS